jgi:23S rRNA pseudouridine1911/1915/1917 synthase
MPGKRHEPATSSRVHLLTKLQALFPDSSGRARKQWVAAGRVRVNGQVVRRGDIELGAEDRVELGMPVARSFGLLRLVHEDDDLIVVDKPPGLLTIATERERERTAYRMLAGERTTHRGRRLFIVHRLDRETSGLICFAKSIDAKRAIQAQFAARSATRIYVAVVEGRVAQDNGVLRDWLREDRSLRVRATTDRRAGKDAVTHYRVLERRGESTLLEVTLVTGRRGQIRVQLARAGHPILGDHAHGSRRDPLRRLCLHATRLAFRHPGSGDTVTFESAPPQGFRRA